MRPEKRQKFAIRKFSVGVASVVVGQFFIGPMQTPVRANEVTEVTAANVVETPKQQVGDTTAQVVPQPKEVVVSPKNVEQPTNYEVKPTVNVETTTSKLSTVDPEVHEKPELDVKTLKETTKTEEKPTTSTNEKIEESVKEPKIEKEPKEETEKSEKKEVEDKELEELKVRYSNTMIEIKAVGIEAEQLLKKVDPNKLSKASLQAAYQLAKQEEIAAQTLLAKEKLTKAELQSALERLEAVVERLYSELKANGHSGDVRFMLDMERDSREENTPYITVENESNYTTVTKDGREIILSYKTGTSRIDPKKGVELTQGAKDLGLTYDSTNQRISGKITLDKTVKAGTYDIGLVSKDGQYKKSVSLTIRNPGTFVINTATGGNQYLNPSAADGSDNELIIPTTTFGYIVGFDSENLDGYDPNSLYSSYSKGRNYLDSTKRIVRTIRDVKKDTFHYYTEFGLQFTDTSVSIDKARIDKFERLDTNADVEYELVDLSKIEPGNHWNNSFYYDFNLPYRVRFTKLPKQQSNFTIKFKTTDSFGTEKIFTVPVKTEERAVAYGSDDSYRRLNYYLTHADVLFDADKRYQVKNPIPVAVDKTSEAQKLGELLLNKENAELIDITAPDGITITRRTDDPTKYTITKENGKILDIGVHKIKAKAKDGHYGEDAPIREFTFEVIDGLNTIGHQTWTEGQAIPNIPVSMTNGSKITSLSVESGGDYIHLTSNEDHTGVTGYALKKTDGIQTAYVTATYTNNEGQSRQIKTKFTYEVTSSPVMDLSLEISNDKQTVSEGTRFKDMAVTATEGAKITVGTLPAGVSYDAEHKILSGVGQYEGHHIIPVTVTKNGASITKLVELTVTPGNFSVPTVNYTFTAGETIPEITLNIPSNATVSSVGGDLPRGLSWSADRKTITGTPTQVGTFQVYGYVNRTTADGTNQSTYAYINITVNSVPLNFSIPDNTKTVKALDELPPINLQADGAVLSITSGSLPPGVNFDAATKTVSGTPTKVGTYTATFTATSPTISGNSTASATLTINVTPRDLSVDVKNKEQEKNVLSAIDEVVLNPSDNKARLEVDTSQLPPGVTYDAASRMISGKPSKVGEYLISYKATFPEMAESPVAGGHIKINVRPLPVSINVTEKEQTVRAGTAIKNMVVTHSEHSNLGARYLSVDLPEGDIDSYLESIAGLNYNASTHTITGTPTKPGVYRIRLKASIDSPNLGKGSAEEIITLTVVDDPVSLDIKNDRQMIALGKTSLRPITFTVPADATLTFDETKLPAGVTYDKASKTISGTPTAVGAFDIPVTVTSAGGKSITKDITIDVVDLTPPTPTVTVKENNDGTHTITISQPNGQPVETIIKNGKDGETPKVKVDRDETKKETTLTFYSDKNANNQFDEDTDTVLGTSVIKDGQDGVAGAKGEKGDAGENGRDGKDVLNGKVNPEASLGKDGDTFINTTTGGVLVKKDGEWKPVGNMKGVKGDKGEQGLQGRDGKDGFTPAVSVITNPDGSHTISITQPDGKEPITTTVKNGENGKDGRSPRVELKPIYPAQPRSARRARSVDEDRATTQPTAKPIGVHITVYYDNDNSLTYTAGDTLISEEDIYNGVDGRDGRDGIDGKSAIIETRENSDGSHTFIITNADGTKREIVVKNGQDGKSPTIETKENEDGSHTIVITNSDGTKQEIVVKNGKDGKDGRDGKDGTCNCNVNPTPVQPGAPGTTPSEQPKPELKPDPKPETNKPNTPGAVTPNTGTPETDKPNAPGEGTPNTGTPETEKPNTPGGSTPNTGGNSETPGGNTPERQTPPTNGNVPPVYEEPTVERDSQPNETNSTPPANTSTGTPIEEVNEETPIVTVTTTGVNISNGRLPETGTKYDTIYIVLGSGILLSLYMGKRKEESSNEME